ncbi:MAG: FAD-binding protein [Candidatus Dadabacteria bacterium]|nr:FAD-binding protein [Candidatus Dadabacteria bacterium]
MNKPEIIKQLESIMGKENVLYHKEDTIVYEQDAFVMRAIPDFVVFPSTTSNVSEIVKLANREGIPIVARGAGTGISGGAIPIAGGIMISLTKMNRILEIDLNNRLAVVEPGVVNLELTKVVSPYGLFYAPDPSSQMVCTLGGNVAENAGGIHCIAYGVTTNHVLGLEVVLPDGEVVELGGKSLDSPGYDLVGIMVGSEGTLGIVTKIILRLTRRAEAIGTMIAIFDSIDDAGQTVADIIGNGIIPTALEMMDALSIRAVEEVIHAGYPLDAEAVLLIELEGLNEILSRSFPLVKDFCIKNRARDVRIAETEIERERLWKGRKSVAGAIGKIAPNQYTQDGVVPRPKLPEVLRKVIEIGKNRSLLIANVAHAGDGNLHPLILFDPRHPGELERVIEAGGEILKLCVDAGGTITGEHGVGIEKNKYMSWLFSEADLKAMEIIKDTFDPKGIFNPGKIFPTPKGCRELRVRPIGIGTGEKGIWI